MRNGLKALFFFGGWVGVLFFCFLFDIENGSLAVGAPLSDFSFKAAPPRSGTGMRLEQLGQDSIRFAMTGAADFGSEWIYANFDHESTAQQKLAFRVKGRPENGGAFFHPILVVRDGPRDRSITGPRIPTSGGDWHLYVLGLDSDFQLGDGRYTIKSLQFSFNSEREPIGKVFSVEVDKIRFADPDEVANRKAVQYTVKRDEAFRCSPKGLVSFSESSGSATPERGELGTERKESNTIAVYFDFDNNDRESSVSMKGRNEAEVEDYCGDFGFRDLLLENCPLFSVAERPEDADVLVYQRTTPSDQAAAIVRLVRAGKPLVLYGTIPDPEIAKLAPLELSKLTSDRFAVRERLTVEKSANWGSADSLFGSRAIQDAALGRYFDAKPTEGASVLLRFSGSRVPYLARKGNVLHFAGTAGTNLISSRTFYDKCALLCWLNLAGTKKSVEVLERIESSVPKRKVWQENGLTWRQTTPGFGRFGWLVGESGLVDTVAPDLTVLNGDQSYRLDVCSSEGDAVNRIKMASKTANSVGSVNPGDSVKSGKADCSLTGRCDEICKQYVLTDPEKPGRVAFTMSLLSPFEIWQFERADRVFLTQENIAEQAAWETNQGLKIVSLKEDSGTQTLYDVQRDGPWSQPWLLLYREKTARPLLVVFSSQPKRISARYRYGVLEGFELVLGERKTLIVGWPWGAVSRDFPGSKSVLTDSMKKQISAALGLALRYPIGRTESFALDSDKGRIRFRTDVSAISIPNDWNCAPEPVVCLPPLTAYVRQVGSQEGKIADSAIGSMVQTEGDLQDFDIPTPWGPMVGTRGTSIEWSLPTPEIEDLLMVRVQDERINSLQSKLFMDGVQWTCGGHVPLDRLSPATPSGANDKNPNISHFTWNFGLGTALQGRLLLDSEAQTQLERRLEIRSVEPLELYQYKQTTRHRTEPFSGLRYPVLFNSFYPNETRYEPNFGSQVIYGDTNEAAVVAAWIGQELADIAGLSDLVRLNWSFYRYTMRHQMYIDDYCYQAGSCRESGAGAWVDMLNAEYSGMLAYARLAQIAGDEDERAEAFSRAAKKALPTVARLYFKPWLERLQPQFIGKTYLITGFGEQGAKTMSFPTQSGNFAAANDLFDFSQGIPGSQYYLYRKYARTPIERYLREIAYPNLLDLKRTPDYDYLAPLAWYYPDVEQVNRYAARILDCPANLKAEDWPGMRNAFELGAWQWRNHGRIAFSRFEKLDVRRAQFDPETRKLDAVVMAADDSRLELSSELVPKKATINGQAVSLPMRKKDGESGFYPIPLNSGNNWIQVEF